MQKKKKCKKFGNNTNQYLYNLLIKKLLKPKILLDHLTMKPDLYVFYFIRFINQSKFIT